MKNTRFFCLSLYGSCFIPPNNLCCPCLNLCYFYYAFFETGRCRCGCTVDLYIVAVLLCSADKAVWGKEDNGWHKLCVCISWIAALMKRLPSKYKEAATKLNIIWQISSNLEEVWVQWSAVGHIEPWEKFPLKPTAVLQEVIFFCDICLAS